MNPTPTPTPPTLASIDARLVAQRTRLLDARDPDERTAVMRAIDGLLDQRGAQTGAQAHASASQATSGAEEAHGDPRPIPGRESGAQEAQP